MGWGSDFNQVVDQVRYFNQSAPTHWQILAYEGWTLWAGAGQCDTGKGLDVGTVDVDYVGDYVVVTYNVAFPYIIKETHVYVDTGMFPQLDGKNTTAPGQYYNASPFGGQLVYVIAHAVVGIPDPDFGPLP